MIGLRRLACTINQESRIIDVEIPEHCEHYLDSRSLRYFLCIQLMMASCRPRLQVSRQTAPSIDQSLESMWPTVWSGSKAQSNSARGV